MTNEAKRELAAAILELAPLVAAMCRTGYVDFPEWAERIMLPPGHEVA
jgi:hypothetical protein